MQTYEVTVTIEVVADDDNTARGIIDQALDEWNTDDGDDGDPYIAAWSYAATKHISDHFICARKSR